MLFNSWLQRLHCFIFRAFEIFILVAILLNCASLAATDPTEDPENPSSLTETLVLFPHKGPQSSKQDKHKHTDAHTQMHTQMHTQVFPL